MCAQEHSREWSGVLFYTTTGSFGEDDFAIIAEEFYLMDVGTSVFTGYDFDSEFIAHLMGNPRLLQMKKGHIHSHNTMNVFFSTTDTDEIRDNSEFHNYYFSLIVNNKNEMLAKVAFRGKQVTKSTTSYSYKGDNGVEKTGAYETNFETEVCYVYNTSIRNPFLEDLSSKYQIIKSRPVAAPTHKLPNLKGKHDEPELPFPKREKGKDFYWEGDDQVDVWGDEAIGAYDTYPVLDKKTEGFIVKVMLGNTEADEKLSNVIKRFSSMKKWELTALQGRMEKRLMSIYVEVFPEDQHLTLFNDIMTECQEQAEMLEKECPDLAETLWEVFNTETK